MIFMIRDDAVLSKWLRQRPHRALGRLVTTFCLPACFGFQIRTKYIPKCFQNWQTKNNKSRSGGIKIQVQGLQNRGLEGSGGVLGRLGRQNRLGAVLEPFWSRPGSVLEASWGRLGASWKRLGGVLWASSRFLGPSCGPFGASGGVLEASCACFSYQKVVTCKPGIRDAIFHWIFA